MAPTKRTSWTWKEKVVILDKLELLEHGTSRRSAAEQLDIIGFGGFHNTVGISRMNWAPPVSSSSRLYEPLWSDPGVDDITGFYGITLSVTVICQSPCRVLELGEPGPFHCVSLTNPMEIRSALFPRKTT